MNTQFYAVNDPEDLLKEFRKIIKEELSETRKEDTTSEETPYIKIDAVCKILQISKPTVYQWVSKKLIKIYKVSSRTYFNKEEILDFLKSQK
jgi:excisionase family DNA binding protein